jgi:hypothetical protein
VEAAQTDDGFYERATFTARYRALRVYRPAP